MMNDPVTSMDNKSYLTEALSRYEGLLEQIEQEYQILLSKLDCVSIHYPGVDTKDSCENEPEFPGCLLAATLNTKNDRLNDLLGKFEALRESLDV